MSTSTTGDGLTRKGLLIAYAKVNEAREALIAAEEAERPREEQQTARDHYANLLRQYGHVLLAAARRLLDQRPASDEEMHSEAVEAAHKVEFASRQGSTREWTAAVAAYIAGQRAAERRLLLPMEDE